MDHFFSAWNHHKITTLSPCLPGGCMQLSLMDITLHFTEAIIFLPAWLEKILEIIQPAFKFWFCHLLALLS